MSDSQPLIYVEYCTSCGLAQQFSALKAAVHKSLPELRVEGNPQLPRMKSFEVSTADGTLLYSKITTGRVPDMPALINILKSHLATSPHSFLPPSAASSSHASVYPSLNVAQVIVPPPNDATRTAAVESQRAARTEAERKRRQQREYLTIGVAAAASLVLLIYYVRRGMQAARTSNPNIRKH